MANFAFNTTQLPWVYLIEPKMYGDDRGFFMETYNYKEFKANGVDILFVQDNHSKSKKWVFRWLHFQKKNPQAKLARVIHWSVLDIVIDLRNWSWTYGKHEIFLLTAENKKQIFIPQGFGHGFLTLEEDTEFLYKCDDFYTPEEEWWIIYNDPDIGIDRDDIKRKYNIKEISISDKDKNNIKLSEFVSPFII